MPPSDGRAHVALPVWTGVVSACAACALGGVALVATLRLSHGGAPLTALLVCEAVAGAAGIALLRRCAARVPIHVPTRRDVVVVAVAFAALVATRFVLARAGVVVAPALLAPRVDPHLTGILVAALAIGPLVEEIVFRGLLFGGLAGAVGVVPAALLSGVAFALAHGEPAIVVAIAALGVVNALAYAATRNLTVPIALHVANNALALLAVVSP